MTVEHIAFMDWDVKTLSTGERMYTNTTEGITGVAVIGEPGKFSYVVVVEDETSPRYSYNNAEFSEWNIPRTWGILESLAEAMYDVEQDMIEDSYDTLYEIGERYDDYDDYDYEYERDSDLYNEH
ncbi:hypothetical protein SEA_LUCKYSOCKE_211 [Streptomyces phage LuckySocke]|jgi:hypothetical protein|nr:hypothetical protein SEA_ALONE_215 [Streptomyces phage Alone3]WPH58857.1 hypothetical protein SEA_LUCKYSOCKE_211 [Streptomyces phage LuckySocke]